MAWVDLESEPRRPPSTAMRAAAVPLALVGLAALLVGFSALVGTADIGVQFIGFATLAAGVIIVAAAVCVLFISRGWAAWLGLLGAVLGVTLGTVLAWAQLRGNARSPFGLISAAIIVFSVPAGVLVGGRLRLRDLKSLKVLAGIFASIISVGALTGLVDFVYHAVYLPAQVTPTLTIAPTMSRDGRHAGMDVVTISLALKNPTSTKVRVLASLYKVAGYKVAPSRSRAPAFAEQERRTFVRDSSPLIADGASRYSRTDKGTVVEAGPIFSPTSDFEFEPGEEFASKVTAYVPHARFDLLRLTAEVIVAKSDRLSLAGQRKFPFGRQLVRDGFGSQSILAVQDVRETSLIRKLTRSRRSLVYIWTVKPSAEDPLGQLGPHVSVFVDRNLAEPSQGLEERLGAYYGITGAYSTTEMSMSGRRGRR